MLTVHFYKYSIKITLLFQPYFYSSKRESDLKIELQKSLKNNQSLRTQNQSLKEKFDELKHKVPVSEEKAKFYESRYQESEVWQLLLYITE